MIHRVPLPCPLLASQRPLRGWDLTLEYAVSAASVARGWSEHLLELFRALGADIPKDYTGWRILGPPIVKNYKTGEFEASGNWFDFPAVAAVVICTLVCIRGIRESLKLNFVMVVIKVSGMIDSRALPGD